IKNYKKNKNWCELSDKWMLEAFKNRYMYNFSSLGRPIIQTPAEIVALQEIIWEVKPDLILETGIAHGGSLIQSASMLALIDYCEAVEEGKSLNPKDSKRKVIGLDIDIREHNRKALETHPMYHKLDLIQGSSIDKETIDLVYEKTKDYKNILVCLDSNHTHEHVLKELEAFAPLVSKGSYCIVLDTIIEDLPKGFFPDRPWEVGDNSKTAVWEYLKNLQNKEIKARDGEILNLVLDKVVEDKLMITVAPDGFLKRI
ncbi:MAG: cephalosporin hydroxylase family protein, partial [Leptospiraceae bacterium]|nr:cephalosporin hydroxylase family protein [Leptospiraceae bacterium]